MKVIILGSTGMIGSALLFTLSKNKYLNVCGCSSKNYLPKNLIKNKGILLLKGFNLENHSSLENIIEKNQPNVVINCAGIVKQSSQALDYLKMINLNSIIPHKLNLLSQKYKFKIIQVSTDCVYSGKKGNYDESDIPDPIDIYGKSKSLGELINNNNLTLRCSLVGFEFFSKNGLLEWFLDQKYECKGFKNAIFSGLSTFEFAKVVENIILDHADLKGLFHISSTPISKYEFLKKISLQFSKKINIVPDVNFKINRSLNSSLFSKETGIKISDWDVMIKELYGFRCFYV
jgi:dTDP-4-dehydrorhamnose reductase